MAFINVADSTQGDKVPIPLQLLEQIQRQVYEVVQRLKLTSDLFHQITVEPVNAGPPGDSVLLSITLSIRSETVRKGTRGIHHLLSAEKTFDIFFRVSGRKFFFSAVLTQFIALVNDATDDFDEAITKLRKSVVTIAESDYPCLDLADHPGKSPIAEPVGVQ